MKRYENMCVGCPPEIGCLGNTCPQKNVLMYDCDVCQSEEAKYIWDGDDYCIDCINNALNDAFRQLSLKEKAEALGCEIKEINGE